VGKTKKEKETEMETRKGIIKCPITRGLVNKNEYCPNETCDSCLLKKVEKKEAKTATNNPRDLADAYLDGKSILNDTLFQGIAHEVYGRRDGKGDLSIRVSGKLRLRPSIKDQIHTALADFLLSIYVTSKEVVKNRIKEYHKSRRGEHRFKKILDTSILSRKTKEGIKDDLSRLEQYGKGRHTYSPINEVDYFVRLLRIEGYTMALAELPDKPIPIEKMRVKDLISQERKKLNDLLMLNTKFKEGRPAKMFFKTMQVVVYRILAEKGRMAKEEAKHLTAIIINEYLKEHGITHMANLDYKDIDNAIHGS
jgi:hypothetical protein